MDIANKTRCYRQSKRFDLFSGQWEEKRFLNHRKKIENATPRIDFQTPKSAAYQHVKVRFLQSNLVYFSVLIAKSRASTFYSHFLIRYPVI